MRRLLPALLLLVAARPAWGHPMPSSAVVLRLHRTEIDAELTLPIGELAMGWEKPLPSDAVADGAAIRGGTRRITSARMSARLLPTGGPGR